MCVAVCTSGAGFHILLKHPWAPPLASGPPPAVSIPLTPIHFGVTLTANNFTSEAFKDSICPFIISKETRKCIKGPITLYLTLWPRRSSFCKNRLTIAS